MLVENEVEKSVLKILKPYKKIQLSYLSFLTGLDEEILVNLLTKLIVDDSLSYIIDGSAGCLQKVEVVEKPSEHLLRQAIEVLEVVETWL